MRLEYDKYYEIYNLNWSQMTLVTEETSASATILLEECTYFPGVSIARFDIDMIRVVKKSGQSQIELYSNDNLVKIINPNDTSVVNSDYIAFKVSQISAEITVSEIVSHELTYAQKNRTYMIIPSHYTTSSGYKIRNASGTLFFTLRAVSGYSLKGVNITAKMTIDHTTSGGSWTSRGTADISSCIERTLDTFTSKTILVQECEIEGDPIDITTKGIEFTDNDYIKVIGTGDGYKYKRYYGYTVSVGNQHTEARKSRYERLPATITPSPSQLPDGEIPNIPILFKDGEYVFDFTNYDLNRITGVDDRYYAAYNGSDSLRSDAFTDYGKKFGYVISYQSGLIPFFTNATWVIETGVMPSQKSDWIYKDTVILENKVEEGYHADEGLYYEEVAITGNIIPVEYGEDVTISIGTKWEDKENDVFYRFSGESAQLYKELMLASLEHPENYFESMDVTVSSNFQLLIVTFRGVKDSFDLFVDATIEPNNINLVPNPKIIYNYSEDRCTLINISEQKYVAYGDSLRNVGVNVFNGFTLNPDDVSIKLGKMDVTRRAWDLKTRLINLSNITRDVTVNVYPSIDYQVIFHQSSTSETILTYHGNKLIDSILVTKEDNVLTIKVNGETLGSLTVPLEKDEDIIGFGVNDSKEILIPLNTLVHNIDVSLYGTEEGELNLYPIVIDTTEPTTFEIELYNMNCDKNKVDKTDGIVLITTLTGTLRESSDVVNPVIKIESANLPKFNYVYIRALRRYYFLNEITVISNKLYQISLHVDVLNTYKNEIRSQNCIVARNEYEYNDLLLDVMRKTTNEREVTFMELDDQEDSWFLDEDIDRASFNFNDNMSLVLEVMGEK